MLYTPLQIREIFHLKFLQEFLRKFNPSLVTLKGGVNLRFFFKSRRYSEDMDLDVKIASISSLQKSVMKAFTAIEVPLRAYGITKIVLPSLKSAKQTETTQRFKVHLHTRDGLDLFTKVEFSRRGASEETKFERVDEEILKEYRLTPVIVQHYTASSAFKQKLLALAGRTQVQSRDVYDLYQLLTFLPKNFISPIPDEKRREALQRAQKISYLEYRESVVAYLAEEDQRLLSQEKVWEEIKGHVLKSLQEGRALS